MMAYCRDFEEKTKGNMPRCVRVLVMPYRVPLMQVAGVDVGAARSDQITHAFVGQCPPGEKLLHFSAELVAGLRVPSNATRRTPRRCRCCPCVSDWPTMSSPFSLMYLSFHLCVGVVSGARTERNRARCPLTRMGTDLAFDASAGGRFEIHRKSKNSTLQ